MQEFEKYQNSVSDRDKSEIQDNRIHLVRWSIIDLI